jgi:hypothetical protein
VVEVPHDEVFRAWSQGYADDNKNIFFAEIVVQEGYVSMN